MPLIIMTHTRYYQSKQLRILHTSCEFVVIVKKLSKQIVPNLKYCGYWSLYILIKRVLYDENLKKKDQKVKKRHKSFMNFLMLQMWSFGQIFFCYRYMFADDVIEAFKKRKTKPGLHFLLPCNCNLLQLLTASSIVLTSVVVPLLIFISANFVYTKY